MYLYFRLCFIEILLSLGEWDKRMFKDKCPGCPARLANPYSGPTAPNSTDLGAS